MCEGNQTNVGGLCCNKTQVNDNGICKDECSLERPVENAGICECLDDLVQLRNGLCCNNDFLNGSCAQEVQRKSSVKEFCLIDENPGLCKIITDCKTMNSPERGTCSKINHVCCIVQAPDQVNTTTVARYLANIVSVF